MIHKHFYGIKIALKITEEKQNYHINDLVCPTSPTFDLLKKLED